MQGMIGHHAQALEMTALLPSRTATDAMKLLAKRIEVSQTDEIRMMQRWLDSRGLEAPSVHAHHAPGATLMPGMLTADEMSRLAEAKGVAFDRLFLELMIKHHEGAGRRRHRRAASAVPRSINWTSWRGSSRPTPPRRRTASRHG